MRQGRALPEVGGSDSGRTAGAVCNASGSRHSAPRAPETRINALCRHADAAALAVGGNGARWRGLGVPSAGARSGTRQRHGAQGGRAPGASRSAIQPNHPPTAESSRGRGCCVPRGCARAGAARSRAPVSAVGRRRALRIRARTVITLNTSALQACSVTRTGSKQIGRTLGATAGRTEARVKATAVFILRLVSVWVELEQEDGLVQASCAPRALCGRSSMAATAERCGHRRGLWPHDSACTQAARATAQARETHRRGTSSARSWPRRTPYCVCARFCAPRAVLVSPRAWACVRALQPVQRP